MANNEIIETGASVINMIDVLDDTITSVRTLRKEQKEADTMFINLGAQLWAIRVAFTKIKDWTETDLVDSHHYLVMNIDVAVCGCRMLVGLVNACVADLRNEGDENDPKEFLRKVKLVFDKVKITDLQKIGQNITKALGKVIEASQCDSISEQKNLLERPGTVRVFRRVQHDTESLLCQHDANSFISRCTDGISKLSIVFEFDQILFVTNLYDRWLRRSAKESLRRKQERSEGESAALPEQPQKTDAQTDTESQRSLRVNNQVKSRTELPWIQINSISMGWKRAVRGLMMSHDNEIEQKRRSQAIDRQIEEDSRRLRREVKVLLLGDAEPRKELMGMMKIIHQGGHTLDEPELYRITIYKNLIDCAKALVGAMAQFGIAPEHEKNQNHCAFLKEFSVIPKPDQYLGDNVGDAISSLWNDPCIPKLMEHSSEFYLMDSAPYFFDHASRICSTKYIPIEMDVLRARTKTTGISETRFLMGSLSIHMFDVGGQRSERSKWIHCFEDITSIIFTVDLSCYDQVLLEEPPQNRMMETLLLFDSTVNSRWFMRTSIILLLDRVDLFKQKLARRPLSNYFPDYSGGNDVNRAAKYILWRFNQVNRAHLNLYPHLTQTTDPSNIRLVFAAIKETILSQALRDSGIK